MILVKCNSDHREACFAPPPQQKADGEWENFTGPILFRDHPKNLRNGPAKRKNRLVIYKMTIKTISPPIDPEALLFKACLQTPVVILSAAKSSGRLV